MSEAPWLSPRDIEEELRAIHRNRHRRPDTALFGRGEPSTVSVQVHGDTAPRAFEVVPVRCELELRQALQRPKQAPPRALLVDYGTQLPLDVMGRLAGGRVHFVAPARRLARLFGAGTASAELLASPLAQALLEGPATSFSASVTGTTVDLETAWRWFLHQRVGLSPEAGLSEDRVLAFCATSGRGEDFGQYLQTRPALREALHEHLGRSAGPVARIAWRAWERGRGRYAAALALLLEVAAPRVASDGYLRALVSGLLGQVEPPLAELPRQDPALLLRWGELGGRLALRLSAEELEPLLEEAEGLLKDSESKDALAESRWLPGAFARTAGLFGRALTEALAATADPAPLHGAVDLLRRLERHWRASREGSAVERARMAVRLLAWLRSRRDVAELARDGSAYEEMVLLAEQYASEGGFVDFALRSARGGTADALGEAVARVVAAASALRDADDARFAKGLAAWLPGRKADRVVPVDTALDRFAVAFLQGAAHRRLLVLLLDGMAWANVVELLMDLESHHVAPVRWGARGSALLPPMLAALPTVTEVSRSAFFAGRLPSPGDTLDTAKDPQRFAEHRGLGRVIQGAPPRLLLRADVQTASGDASERARQLVLSEDRVVAVVVNAIDEQLKGSRQLRVEYTLRTIKPLKDLLQAAREAGRAVLMVSDHGHVPGARMSRVAAPGAAEGNRWRALAEGEAPRENEVALSSDSVWRPRGRSRVALLFRETDSYGSTSHEGEHGGASLAEVVAPAVLLASDSLAQRYEDAQGNPDRELEVVAFPRPRWWDYEVRAAPQPVPAPRVDVPAEPPPQAAFAFSVPERPAPRSGAGRASGSMGAGEPAGGVSSATGPLAKMLRAWPLHKELGETQRRELEEKILPWVEVLSEHDGRMAPELFARRTGVLPYRVRGAVSRMAEWLNLDAQPVVSFDEAEQLVRLDLEALKQIFGGVK